MKKILLFLALFSLVLSVAGVYADTQQIGGEVPERITVAITPATITFASLIPGTNDNPGSQVSFDATGSNVNVKVEITNITGNGLFDALKFDSAPALGYTNVLDCTLDAGICTYVTENAAPTLSVPVGTPAGTKTGTIVYTLTSVPFTS